MRRRSSDRSTRTRLARAAWLLTCGMVFASIGGACGGNEDERPEPAVSPAPAAPAPGEVAPSAEAQPAAPAEEASGEATATEGVIPEGYPSDVPVYPGATPGSAMSMPGLGVFATFESDDAVDKVLEHYRGELGKSGWSVADAADGSGVDGTKGARSVQVRARHDEKGRTEIAINVSER